MEHLISVAFDNLSSQDLSKKKKGLRQIEALLAQICVPKTTASAAAQKQQQLDRRQSLLASPNGRNQNNGGVNEKQNLGQLRNDGAYQQFFRLQNGFEWNLATRLIFCLEGMHGRGKVLCRNLDSTMI
jgi:hypothetical protein